MTRQEALEQFREETAPVLEQCRNTFSENLVENMDKLTATLKKSIADIRAEAERLDKEPIMFFTYALLRFDVLEQTYKVLLQARDARWYMDTEPAETTFFMEYLFHALKGVREKMLEESRKYLGKVNAYDVANLIQQVVMDCNSLLAQQLRFIFRDVEENPDFEAIKKTDTWVVYWGEYRGNVEMIAHVDREKKNQLDWDRALRRTQNVETEMIFSFWYEAVLKDSDCKGKLLYFIQFENCTLENICFDEAVLSGARFRNCVIKNCTFRDAEIRQADFSNCTWSDNIFTGADMENSVFTEEELPFAHLEPEQLQDIFIDRRHAG